MEWGQRSFYASLTCTTETETRKNHGEGYFSHSKDAVATLLELCRETF